MSASLDIGDSQVKGTALADGVLGPSLCPDGEIGKHEGLKILWSKDLASSSLAPGTNH